MKTAVIIPARYNSVRLPGKPLIEVKGKPIIQWVYEQAKKIKLADYVIIATDDHRIFNAVKRFNGNVTMTSPDHKSGSDRIAEVVKNNTDITIAVNVQGDEPLIDPESVNNAIKSILSDENIDISTLIREIKDKNELSNPNLVKVVTDNKGKALYFSRSQIPYERQEGQAKFYAHIGLYVYRRESLLKMTQLEQTDLEKAECLEQLRALQNGFAIKTVLTNHIPVGIDTPEDLEEFSKLVENNHL